MEGKITYHQQVSYCGKARCRRCREGIGHGSYWYAYQTVNGRTVRTYIGKDAPAEVLAKQGEGGGSSQEFAHTLLRLYVLGQFRLEQRAEPPAARTPAHSATNGGGGSTTARADDPNATVIRPRGSVRPAEASAQAVARGASGALAQSANPTGQASNIATPVRSAAAAARAAAKAGAAAVASIQWEQITDASLQHQRVRSLLSCLISGPGRKLARE